MGPKQAERDDDVDLLRVELMNLIDQRPELVRLAALIDWGRVQPTVEPALQLDYGKTGVVHTVMAALLYLKHVYALSDEDVVERRAADWSRFAKLRTATNLAEVWRLADVSPNLQCFGRTA